jgi:hypothetical protein
VANLRALGSSLPGCSDERWQALADGTAEPTPAEVAALLALSAERDRYESRIRAAWREGFAAGRGFGRREGYTLADAERAAEWEITGPLLLNAVGPTVNPDGYARRNVRAAEAATRREAPERERVFVAKAYATRDDERSDAQRATVHSYPPPSRGRAPHLRVVEGGRD